MAAATPFPWSMRASFRPKGEIAELRPYLRQRERLLDYAACHIQHMQKSLTEMNLQLQHVVTDITGATGMRIIRAIIGGERNPAALALLRDALLATFLNFLTVGQTRRCSHKISAGAAMRD